MSGQGKSLRGPRRALPPTMPAVSFLGMTKHEGMIAIPIYQSRVAPVLDWCSTILLIPEGAESPWHYAERLAVGTNVFELLRLLHGRKVSHVICGALSPHALRYGQHLGMEFICGISGAIEDVVEAYRAGELNLPRFRLPGCRCTGTPGPSPGQHETRCRSDRAPVTPVSEDREEGGPMRRRQGRGRIGRGVGSCMTVECTENVYVCPQCGWEAPYSRGAPPTHRICPTCGIPLVRTLTEPESLL